MFSVRTLCPLALGLIFVGGTASADDSVNDRRLYLSPMASYTFADNNRGADYGVGGQLSIGTHMTPMLDLQLIGVYSNYSTKESDFPASLGPQPSTSSLYGYGLGANIAVLRTTLPHLYLHLDVMAGKGESVPGVDRNYNSTLFNVGLGYDIPLKTTLGGLVGPGMALRIEGLYRLDEHGNGELANSSDEQHQYFQEPVFNIGLKIPLGKYKEVASPTEPEQPVAVVPVDAETTPAAPETAAVPCDQPSAGEKVNLDGCKAGDTIILRGVNFDTGSSHLTLNAQTLLNPVVDALVARPSMTVEIDGHTDDRGTLALNQKLSEQRAETVRAYLIDHGVDKSRIAIKGFGKAQPVGDNTTQGGRELNRRVELKIIDVGTATDAAPAAQ
jgi:OOP family OmpA-OmpF porin